MKEWQFSLTKNISFFFLSLGRNFTRDRDGTTYDTDPDSKEEDCYIDL